MPTIWVDDQVYEHLTRYARLWNQTESEAIDTLIRLYNQPAHTVAAPCDGHVSSHDAGEVQL